jgi:hypothetical protein
MDSDASYGDAGEAFGFGLSTPTGAGKLAPTETDHPWKLITLQTSHFHAPLPIYLQQPPPAWIHASR